MAGWILTVVFLPNLTTLDLAEIDRRHRYLLAGEGKHYHGEVRKTGGGPWREQLSALGLSLCLPPPQAVNPKNLSAWERWQGEGAAYNPQADKEQQLLQAHATGA